MVVACVKRMVCQNDDQPTIDSLFGAETPIWDTAKEQNNLDISKGHSLNHHPHYHYNHHQTAIQ